MLPYSQEYRFHSNENLFDEKGFICPDMYIHSCKEFYKIPALNCNNVKMYLNKNTKVGTLHPIEQVFINNDEHHDMKNEKTQQK